MEEMAPATPIACQYQGCTFTTPANLQTIDQTLQMLRMHIDMSHAPATGQNNPQPTAQAQSKPDKLKRPTISEGITEADWVWFKDRWTRYKDSTALTGKDIVNQLWDCASDDLSRRCFEAGPTADITEDELLKRLRKLSIKAQNKLVNIVEFLSMTQDTDEPVAMFTSRLRGQASVCDFSIKCSENVNIVHTYAENMVAHQLVRGLEDVSHQEKVLALAATEKDLTLKKISEFVEAQETGSRSSKLLGGGAGVSKISDHKRTRSNTLPSKLSTEADSKGDKQGTFCRNCGRSDHDGRSVEVRRERCPAFNKACNKCQTIGHFASRCRKRVPKDNSNVVDKKDEEANGGFQVTLFNLTAPPSRPVHKRAGMRVLSHMAVNEFGKWTRRNPEPQPSVKVTVSVSESSYQELSIPKPRNHRLTTIPALPDSGSQVLISGMDLVHSLGVKKHELIPVNQKLQGANNSSINLLGGLLLEISANDSTGNVVTTKQLCYIGDGVKHMLLSKSCCKELGILSQQFPTPGENILKQVDVNKCEQVDPSDNTKCSCPVREPPPPVPESIPYPPTEENIPKLKDWILEYYKSSAFNCCENQEIPLVHETVPMSLHVDPNAKPVAFHKPYPVPVHWKDKVKAGLDNDVKMGVLEKVPVGEPTRWCARMVVVAKKDGNPRRTVDFQHLNKASVRQTHPIKSPFHQATSIPPNTYRTCIDAFQGFHSIPLEQEDRELTTFITEWGRYRYRCLPQGFLAATDGYTDRFDTVTKDVNNLERLVDDACLYDETIQGNFFRSCHYLTHCAKAGFLFSKGKFQFCQKTIDFLGFTVDKDGVKPSDDFIKAIRDFPTPRDITGIRSWFGLVEQCSYAFSKTEVMTPFRHLLKPKSIFEWTRELQETFDKSKQEIINKIIDGIKTYDPSLVTCLAPDFCKTGLGFHLLQKKCKCEHITPVCCKDGWSIVFAGSRFTNQHEARYAAIEGEALAASWAMNKCKHFLMGCDSFILAVDHKPLLGILGNKSLEDIENPRLLRLKEKTLRYNFTVVHVPGSLHKTADATSRSPVSEPETETLQLSSIFKMNDDTANDDDTVRFVDGLLQCNLTNLFDGMESQVMALNASLLSWETLKEVSSKDPKLIMLTKVIENCHDIKTLQLDGQLQEFHRHRDHLSTQAPLVFYKDRVIIPASLRSTVLEILHAGHGGVSSMTARAGSSVWWPGLQSDIERTRDRCQSCNVNMPSNPAMPPTPLPSPAYPFEMISSDYFSYGGHKYLVIVDRFSNWISVYQVKPGAGADALVKLLRQHFLTYGVCAEITTDGAMEYMAGVTQTFLRQWGVRHRVSSAHHPHANTRSELGVKTAKRLIRENTDRSGSLDNNKFARALLAYRNTPCRDLNMSPAQIIFARNIRDHLPILPGHYRPREEWILTQRRREEVLARRYTVMGDRLTRGTKQLGRLNIGDIVSVQNQVGPRPKKWDRTGTIVEILPYDQYRVKMDGSGQTTLRNRQFIRFLGHDSSSPTQPLSVGLEGDI